MWTGQHYDCEGEHLRVAGAILLAPPDPVPEIYFGGSSDATLPVAAHHADVYLTRGEPPAQVAEKIQKVAAQAEEAGRKLRFGVRLHTIGRDTSAARPGSWRSNS